MLEDVKVWLPDVFEKHMEKALESSLSEDYIGEAEYHVRALGEVRQAVERLLEEFDSTFGNLEVTTEPNSPYNHDLFGFCVSNVDNAYLEICFDSPSTTAFRTVDSFQLPAKFFKRLSFVCDVSEVKICLLSMVDEKEIEKKYLAHASQYKSLTYESDYISLFKSFLESD